MYRVLALALIALALAQPVRADIATGFIPGGGYNIYTNDAFDNDLGTFTGAPYLKIKDSVMSLFPGSLSSLYPGIVAPRITLAHTDLGCDSTTSGTLAFDSGLFQGCDGSSYKALASQVFVDANYATSTTVSNLTILVGAINTSTTMANTSLTNAVNSKVSITTLTNGLSTKVNTASVSTVALSGAYADLSGKPALATVATTGAYSDLSGKPSIPSALSFSFANPTHTLNTAFQLNATTGTLANYTVDVTINSLLTTIQGTVILEYADNSGMSTNVVTVNTATSSIGGILNIANTGTVTLGGMIPAGKWVRIRTANTAGTPSFAFRSGQEVTF